jgi:hypothetical protein
MKNLLFILSLSIPVFVIARLSASEVEYKSRSLSFSTSKSETQWTFKDSSGVKTLEIKDCNEKLIQKYWTQLTSNVERLETMEASRNPAASAAWIQFNHEKMDASSLQSFFQKVPQMALAVFSESKKSCK